MARYSQLSFKEKQDKDLEYARKIYEGRNLFSELVWEKNHYSGGYTTRREALFHRWLFDQSLEEIKRLRQKIIDMGGRP